MKSGGVILAAKPVEDRRMWQGWFEKHGRAQDLRILAPDQPWRFNFIKELSKGGQTRNIVHGLVTMAETLQRGEGKQEGGEDQFFKDQTEMQLHHAVEVVKQAGGDIGGDLEEFINGAAQSGEELKSPEWRKGKHFQMIAQANANAQTPMEKHDIKRATDYWGLFWPTLADRTRSGITAGTQRILHTLGNGVIKQLFGSETNTTPQDTLNGVFWLVDMSPSEWGAVGSFASAGVKYLTQQAVLRRQVKDGDGPHVIWMDEAHQFVNSFDSHYLAQCRSRRACMICLSQSVPSYYAAFKGHTGQALTQAFLANFSHVICHACDPVTAQWASSKIGKSLQTFVGTSLAPVEDVYEEIMGRGKVTTSTNEHYEAIIQDNVFLNGLRTGGPPDYCADAIVLRSGLPFSTGENFLFRSFSQR